MINNQKSNVQQAATVSRSHGLIQRMLGRTGPLSEVVFHNSEHMTIPTFLQFGRNYEGAMDEYVYRCFIHSLLQTEDFDISTPGNIFLVRVLKDDILDKTKFEYFSGVNGSAVYWSKSQQEKLPVFKNDSEGVGWNLSVSYNAPLKRYFLMTEHKNSHSGFHGLYDAWNSIEGSFLIC